MSRVLWSSDRPEFVEKVASLAGKTAYREPMQGVGTMMSDMPDAHAIAAALAYAKRSSTDIGPDVAYCWVVRTDAYKAKVVKMLAEALSQREFKTVAGWRHHAAEQAWNALVWDRAGSSPSGASRAYSKMLLVACGTLHNEAWDALSRAQSAYRSAA